MNGDVGVVEGGDEEGSGGGARNVELRRHGMGRIKDKGMTEWQHGDSGVGRGKWMGRERGREGVKGKEGGSEA